MGVHQRHFEQICWDCGAVQTDCRDTKCVSAILLEAFPNYTGNAVLKDSDWMSVNCQCNHCYHLLSKWNKDHSTFKRKIQLPLKYFHPAQFFQADLVFIILNTLENGCPCIQDQSIQEVNKWWYNNTQLTDEVILCNMFLPFVLCRHAGQNVFRIPSSSYIGI